MFVEPVNIYMPFVVSDILTLPIIEVLSLAFIYTALDLFHSIELLLITLLSERSEPK